MPAARIAAVAFGMLTTACLAASPQAPARFHLEFGDNHSDLPSALDLANGLHLQASMRALDSTLYRNRSEEDVEGRLQWLSVGPLIDALPLSGRASSPLRLGLNLGVMVEGSPGLRHPLETDPRDGLLNFRYYPAATFSMSWRFQ